MLTRGQKWAVIGVGIAALFDLSFLTPIYGEICSQDVRTAHQDCATYHVARVWLWQIGELANYYGVAITALATGFVAWFTATLWRTTTEQARLTLVSLKLTRRSIKLARDEFLSSHRPELKIHSIRVLRPETDQGAITAEFSVINGGTADGIVESSAVYLAYREWIDLENLPDLRRNDVIPRRRFMVGASDTIRVNSDDWGALHFVLSDDADLPRTKILYFYGWVAYKELSGSVRTTFFCRQYDGKRERFTPIDDPEANCTY